MAHILVVDDDADFREGLAETLGDLGHSVLEAHSGEQALEMLEAGTPVDCVFLDFRLPGMDGLAVLAALRAHATLQGVAVVMLTAHATSDNTIGAMRLGAFEHLTKPVGRQDIAALLARILSATAASAPPPGAAAPSFAQEGQDDAPRLLGVSESMRAVQKQIGRAAATDATVIITGETGSGKEVAARVLHDASPRRDGPFVAVNCAAIPADLLESELFGHAKGAFTGAISEHTGRLAQAGGGTLLLDEIGDMPMAMQAKLLRVLQERYVTPLGTHRKIAIDIRVIAATHRDLAALAASGAFRQDLRYRLSVIPLHLPPLRERLADILPLAEHFLARDAMQRGRAMHLSSAAQRRLLMHRWPGNVRELKNALERACALAPGPAITADDLAFLAPLAAGPAQPNPHDDGNGWGAQPSGTRLDTASLPPPWCDMPLPQAVEQLERTLIEHALAATGGNRTEAARRLGINRQALYTKMAHLGIE
jgi:DNA-binding NtrC family response regulator